MIERTKTCWDCREEISEDRFRCDECSEKPAEVPNKRTYAAQIKWKNKNGNYTPNP